ncbi:DUF2306 domain-containing protein [Ekhidna sp.]|uniref:DUF2306 domain-containing protein n=1 Tax=Ekhidna sp. TaxID=2608089 RepID=UPI00329A3925
MEEALRIIHIVSGTVAIIVGFGSILPKKGSKWHRSLGKVFFYSMLVMAGLASFLAGVYTHEKINLVIGLFTMYLVITAYWSAKNSRNIKSISRVSASISAILFAAFLFLSINAYQSGEAILEGVYVEAFYVYLVLSLLALSLDIKVSIYGIKGAQRIARHLWRMLLALFIASGSLFMGQPQVFPKAIRDSGALIAPVLIVILSLFYWLIRVYVGRRFRVGR